MIPVCDWDLWDVSNFLIGIIGIATVYCSFRLAHVLNSITTSLWWKICPWLVVWGVIDRWLIVFFSGTPYVEHVAALNLPWWIGITIFVRMVRISSEEIKLQLYRKGAIK